MTLLPVQELLVPKNPPVTAAVHRHKEIRVDMRSAQGFIDDAADRERMIAKTVVDLDGLAHGVFVAE
jgi:hypothetical protein